MAILKNYYMTKQLGAMISLKFILNWNWLVISDIYTYMQQSETERKLCNKMMNFNFKLILLQ